MSSTRISWLAAQAAFDRRPAEVEPGLDVGRRSAPPVAEGLSTLAGAEARHAAYYTLVIEASFVAIDGRSGIRSTPGSGARWNGRSSRNASRRIPRRQPRRYCPRSMAADLADLWRDHRAKTYYQDRIASAEQARAVRQRRPAAEWSVASDAVAAAASGTGRDVHTCPAGHVARWAIYCPGGLRKGRPPRSSLL